jgi:glutathione S-transferase
MKLYSFTGSCALVPNIALEWAGADFELELIKRSATREPELLALNPVGKVPILVLDDGKVLTQVNAILMWIAEEWPDAKLAPKAGGEDPWPLRKWLAQFNGDIHPAFTPYFLSFKFAETKEAQKEVKAKAAKEVEFQLSIVDRHMAGRDWVLDAGRSVADAYLYIFCLWAGFLPGTLSAYPNLAAFAGRMKDDPGVQAAVTAQGLG